MFTKKKKYISISLLLTMVLVIGAAVVFAGDIPKMFTNDASNEEGSDLVVSAPAVSAPLRKDTQAQKSPEVFDIDQAKALIERYLDYKSVYLENPNSFLIKLGFIDQATLNQNYLIDGTSWVFWDVYQDKLVKYFSYDIVNGEFREKFTIKKIEGINTVNYTEGSASQDATVFSIDEISPLEQSGETYSCDVKITTTSKGTTESGWFQFNFTSYNRNYIINDIKAK